MHPRRPDPARRKRSSLQSCYKIVNRAPNPGAICTQQAATGSGGHQKRIFARRISQLRGILPSIGPPPGFSHPDNHDMKLLKPLYGLGIAGNLWYHRLTDFLRTCGFTSISTQLTMFCATQSTGRWPGLKPDLQFVILLATFNSSEAYDSFDAHLAQEFDISSSSDLQWYLGAQISCTADGINLDQEQYVHQLLMTHDMLNCKLCRLPFVPGDNFASALDSPCLSQSQTKIYQAFSNC